MHFIKDAATIMVKEKPVSAMHRESPQQRVDAYRVAKVQGGQTNATTAPETSLSAACGLSTPCEIAELFEFRSKQCLNANSDNPLLNRINQAEGITWKAAALLVRQFLVS